MNAHVDTLKLATRLEAGGFTPEQARTVASALGEAAEIADLVTKSDLDQRLQLLEQRMTIRLGGMLVVMTGVLAAVLRFTH